MNIFTVLIMICVCLVACAHGDVDRVDSKSNVVVDTVGALQYALDDLKTRDTDPVMEVRQYGRFEEIEAMYVDIFGLQNKHTEYLVIKTGEQRGPEDGGGYYHCYMLVNKVWVFISSIPWVS